MTTSLDLLENQFPGKLLLTPQEVASVLGQKPKRLYDLIESDELPFPVKRHGRLLGIPKVGLATWLDGDQESQQDKVFPTKSEAAPVAVRKKRGRPRKALMVMAFQEQLCAEWKIVQLRSSIESVLKKVQNKRSAFPSLIESLGQVEAIDLARGSGHRIDGDWIPLAFENSRVLQFLSSSPNLQELFDKLKKNRFVQPEDFDAFVLAVKDFAGQEH